MSVFEGFVFAVSNEEVAENTSVDLDNAEIIEALEACVTLSDFAAVLNTALEKVMDDHGIDSEDVHSYAEFFAPDWFEVMGYSLHLGQGRKDANGEDPWLEELTVLLHWLKDYQFEDTKRAVLQLLENQIDQIQDFAKDPEEFLESYEGSFENETEFAKKYLYDTENGVTVWMEDFVQWDALIGWLDRNGYSFMEDTTNWKIHVWCTAR